MATDHLVNCIKILNVHLQNREVATKESHQGYEAVFELIEQPWDFTGDKELLIWREGYEQCMTDIVDAIADEWGVALPPDPARVAADKKAEGEPV